MKKFYLLMIVLMAMSLPGTAKEVKSKKAARKAVTAFQKPVAKPATNVTTTGFTANWEPVAGAEGYAVSVYSRQEVPSDGTYTVLDEDFSGITDGSLLEPLGGEEDYVNLDDYGYGDNAGWSAYGFPNFVPSMVAGLLYSPYLNLTNDGGKYKLVITTYSNDGDEIRVTSHGAGAPVVVSYKVEIANGGTGLYEKELAFSNGSADLFFSIINNTAEVGSADYTDRVQVLQSLKKGDVYEKLVAIDESINAVDERTGTEVTSKTFTDVTRYADGETTLYYNVSAGAYNFGYDENGKFTYDYVQSPYSDWVKVDLLSKESEVVEDDDPADDPTEQDDDDEPGVLTLGHFDGSAEGEGILDNKVAYDGGNWYNAPMAFTYRNSGSQSIYLPEQLKKLQDQKITSISFSCFASDAFSLPDYKSTARIYVTEVDNQEFYVNPETDYMEWFELDPATLSATKELELDFQASSSTGENITITFDLSEHPYTYTGKTLLLTVTNESEQCLELGEYVRFFFVDWKSGDKNRSCTYVSDKSEEDFLYNLTRNKRITATENEVQNYNAPAVQFTYEPVDVADGISSVDASRAAAGFYTLQGVRVESPRSGIYIRDGKKVVIK